MGAAVLSQEVGVVAACDALQVSRATLYRRRTPSSGTPAGSSSHRGLSGEERTTVLTVLNSQRFVDTAPAEVYATLLDEGVYHCSIRTMYRILEDNGQVRERRNQLRHPTYSAPELLATRPNQLWSWDITKLKGPKKWSYFYLYVILDVFSRYVVGWMVADKESAALAKRLIAETIGKQELDPEQLTIHADRGPSMRSKLVAQLLADLGVTKTHSRPYTSSDNPFSESHFRTLKYRPEFPERFGSLEDARTHGTTFFPWYNQEHRHHGLALLTPHQVHYGLAEQVLANRQSALDAAYARHPERFAKPPAVPKLHTTVWINPPDGEGHP
jgi:putative transposase